MRANGWEPGKQPICRTEDSTERFDRAGLCNVVLTDEALARELLTVLA